MLLGSDPGDHIVVDLTDDPETNGSSSGYHSNHESDEGFVNSLELENRLLKNEIASLNEEMSTVIQRSRAAQEGTFQINDIEMFFFLQCHAFYFQSYQKCAISNSLGVTKCHRVIRYVGFINIAMPLPLICDN